MRIYSERLGRFLSVDPLNKTYPWWTPYQFAGNMPIVSVDIDGMEPSYPLNLNEYSNKMLKEYNNDKQFDGVREHEKNKLHKEAFEMSNAYRVVNYFNLNKKVLNELDNPATPFPAQEGKVNLNDKKRGYYDCITSVIGACRILYNDYALETRSTIGKFQTYMEKSGKASSPTNVGLFFSNKKGENVPAARVPTSLPTSTNFGETVSSQVQGKEGTHFFLVNFFGGYHSAFLTVTNYTNTSTGTTSTLYALSDDTGLTGGESQTFTNVTDLNKYILNYAKVQLDTYSNHQPQNSRDQKMTPTITVSKLKKK